jgi:hypothetical protein
VRWGPHREFLQDLKEKTGQLPEALKTRPAPFEDLLPVWEGFAMLHRSRQHGIDGLPQPISVSDLKSFLELMDITGAEADEFVYLVTKLDDRLLALICEKAARK